MNVLHDYEAPGWWAVSAISGLLPLGVVLASALPPDAPRDLITLISTVAALAGFAVITVADGRSVFVTEWTWWATERWRGRPAATSSCGERHWRNAGSWRSRR